MIAHTVEAFVLRTGSLGEADVLVTLFSREEGKVRGVARSARRSRKRFAGTLEPLTRIRVHFVEREGRDLVQVRDVEMVRSFFEMQKEPVVAAACAYMAEVVEQFGREKEADERFFRLVGAALEGLEGGVDPSLAARYFELWTCRLQGLLPDLRSCAACERALDDGARYDPRHGELRCRGCAPASSGGLPVSREALALARSMESAAISEVNGPDPGARRSLGRFLEAVLLGFVERPFVSRKVLEEMTP